MATGFWPEQLLCSQVGFPIAIGFLLHLLKARAIVLCPPVKGPFQEVEKRCQSKVWSSKLSQERNLQRTSAPSLTSSSQKKKLKRRRVLEIMEMIIIIFFDLLSWPFPSSRWPTSSASLETTLSDHTAGLGYLNCRLNWKRMLRWWWWWWWWWWWRWSWWWWWWWCRSWCWPKRRLGAAGRQRSVLSPHTSRICFTSFCPGFHISFIMQLFSDLRSVLVADWALVM